MALDALAVGIGTRKVNYVLDADIRGFFDTLDHGWLMKFVGHRIADQRVLRHIQKWLNAGVLEDGRHVEQEEGTPQGGSISPLLANIYLHYVLDLWAEQWRRTRAHGDVVIVRYADDFVVGFQHQSDAERFLEELRERFRRFNLELHAEKTRILEFGRYRGRATGEAGRRQAGDLQLPGLHARVRQDQAREVHRASADDGRADAGKAQGPQGGAAAAPARAGRRRSGRGSGRCCAGTSATTACPATTRPWTAFAMR